MRKETGKDGFQFEIITDLERMFPGSMVLKNDPNWIQGIPDLIILWRGKWATLEVKRNKRERNNPEPNQEYYVDYMNDMSFSAFIYPENKKEVLDALQRSFESGRISRFHERK